MTHLIERFKAELPIFWVKVRNLAITLGGSLVAILTIDSQFNLQLNSTFMQVVKYSLIACVSIAGTAQFTKK